MGKKIAAQRKAETTPVGLRVSAAYVEFN